MALRLVSLLLLAVPALAQTQALWGQCGGMGWTGATTCANGSTCVYSNPWYSQCLPASSTTSPKSTITSTSSTKPPSSSPTVTLPPSSSTSTPVSPPPSSSSTPATTTCAALTSNPTTVVPKLNDPFTHVSGTRVSSKADWTCRRSEISSLLQTDELGALPPKPSSVTGSISGNTLTVNVSDNGKSISFTVGITYPSGNGPFPAIIAYIGGSIPIPSNIALLNFNNDDIATQNDSTSRGQGKFYTLYGSGHSAGAMMAWAWAVSRIIDALEGIPNSKIDLTKLGVTGCSRDGKGALVAGAFEQRIALTIPQESGSGGAACWRLSDYQQTQGQNVQTASEIVGENVWFSTAFNAFSTSVTKLPFDHHMLAGMVAPRGLFVIENTSMEWLGNLSTYGCMKAATTIFQALGVPNNMGYSQIGNHNHCAFPSSQQSDLSAFINQFLLGQTSNTAIFRSDGTFTYDQAGWQPWTVPTLS